MGTWVLILTLAATIYDGGSAISSVGGFTSADACKAAAYQWVRTVEAGHAFAKSAICVKA